MRLATPAKFFDQLRTGLLGPTLDPSEVAGLNALLAALRATPGVRLAEPIAAVP